MRGNKQKGIYFVIGQLKQVDDPITISGKPRMGNCRVFRKKSQAVAREQVEILNKRKVCMKVVYGKFKNVWGKIEEFHNWGEYKTIKDVREALNLWTEQSLIDYMQSE